MTSGILANVGANYTSIGVGPEISAGEPERSIMYWRTKSGPLVLGRKSSSTKPPVICLKASSAV